MNILATSEMIELARSRRLAPLFLAAAAEEVGVWSLERMGTQMAEAAQRLLDGEGMPSLLLASFDAMYGLDAVQWATVASMLIRLQALPRLS